MYINNKIIIAKNDEKELELIPSMLNRHGIITGATGTGKTVSVKVIAESLSAAGIPSFLADVKGDLSSVCEIGEESESVTKRITKLGLNDFKFEKYPTRFWDIYGKNGHSIKAKVESFNADLLSRILDLSETQEGILNIAFKIAIDEEMPILDFKDLKAILKYVSDNKDKYISKYGNITVQSIATIQRKLLEFENTGAYTFFGEPELNVNSLIRCDSEKNYGYINVLDATELIKDYNLYSTFMLWLLNDLYNKLPEVGDLDKPKLVLFIDEAHLLFDEMRPSMLKKITQIVKLIRSKGVGIFFISQAPGDISEEILSQLGNRIQHNLKAYTPSEMKNVKVAVESFRVNPSFDTEKAILELSTGEALISFMNEDGQPSIVERAFILPPQSKMGIVDPDVRNKIISNSDLKDLYDKDIDNISASELISKMDKKEEKEEVTTNQKDNKKKKSFLEKTINTTISRAAGTIGRKIGDKIFKNLFK